MAIGVALLALFVIYMVLVNPVVLYARSRRARRQDPTLDFWTFDSGA